MKTLSKIRNIGISAHIDSGKTTLTERILFYCDRIHKMEEVRGGGSGATMDHMDLEREKGITITSAATSVDWHGSDKKGTTFAEGVDCKKNTDVRINIIDTPGHVDFTVEVERSLRVLDGAILVLCSVAGVQSQSITVDRQMKRYKVPRIAFLNKIDRVGADAWKGVNALKEKLNHNAVLLQLPIGREDNFKGVVDLITMKALYFEGASGETVRINEIPQEMEEEAVEARELMLDVISEFSDELTEKLLEEEEVTEEDIHMAIRVGVNTLSLTPVLVGSALKNKGVQPVLDAIARYLPSPLSSEPSRVIDNETDKTIEVSPSIDEPLIAMAFKITDEQFGQLTYTRLYQGTIRKGMMIYNTRTKKKIRVGRLVRMHANFRENIEVANAGDIIAMVGVDCASGDTFVGDESMVNLSCEGMHVPIPVIELAVSAKDKDQLSRLSKGLQRFLKEDPTFHVYTDQESGETRIAGMGELHLEIYIERLRREYKVNVEIGAPQVNYRETIRSEAKFDYTHKKQTGGAGQFAQVVGRIQPLDESDKEKEDQIFKFNNKIKGGSIPTEYIGACEAGFKDVMDKGPLADFPLINVEVFLEDGKHHDVDSSDLAFRTAARYAMREAVKKGSAALLEPLMKVEVETPDEYQGSVIGDLSSRRGVILGTQLNPGGEVIVGATVPLSEMFGYATELRSMTSGKAGYTMEFSHYDESPKSITEEILKARAERVKSQES